VDAAGTIARLRPLLLDLEEAAALEPPGVTESAVLVPLTIVDDEVRVVFTRRRDDLRRHAGEFSFPGGRRDPGEANLIETALRETEEEVGIDRSMVELIGALQPTATIATDFAIHPFVGVVPAGSARVAEPAEVAEVIEVPLGELVASRERRRLTRRDLAFHTTVYPLGDRVIWGATARMLDDLVDRLGVDG
jgi:8-oxo-dGTP pyrophosphatase MutT (NUDIX family)